MTVSVDEIYQNKLTEEEITVTRIQAGLLFFTQNDPDNRSRFLSIEEFLTTYERSV